MEHNTEENMGERIAQWSKAELAAVKDIMSFVKAKCTALDVIYKDLGLSSPDDSPGGTIHDVIMDILYQYKEENRKDCKHVLMAMVQSFDHDREHRGIVDEPDPRLDHLSR